VLESPLRLFSIFACLIIIAGWLAFAVDQTRDGSEASQRDIAGQVASTQPATVHHGSVRRTLDDANDKLLSPFDGLVSANSGDWTRHTLPAVLGLLIYGFGVGYLARFARGRGGHAHHGRTAYR